MNSITKHWQTSLAGIAAAIAHVVAFGAGGKWTALAIAVLGLVAGDGNKSTTTAK